MKIKKILTCLLLCFMSLTGLFFGCQDKYKNFKIEVNGANAITLTMNSADEDSSKEVLIKISNAPSSASKKLSYSVNKANIVKVEELSSQDENMARFKISALENITSYDPSCVIAFKTAEGNKTCELTVNVEIPVTGISINQAYSPFAITGGEDYYINTASLLKFEPNNTTQRDVTYSLVDPSLQDKFGLTLTENGKINIEKYISGSGANQTALKSFDVQVKSLQDPTKTSTFTVKAYKEITADDVLVAYDYIDQGENPFNYSENKFTGSEELLELSHNGITFATNKGDEKDSVDFGVFLQNGLDYNQIKLEFEKTILNNAVVEDDNNDNNNMILSKHKIYSVNPNVDVLVAKLKYKEIENYEYAIEIPIIVKEFPTSLVVNNSEKVNYNIYDFYNNDNNGQEFKVSVLKAGAYDKTYKIAISEEEFNKIEVKYQGEVLNYNTLINLVLESDSSIYIKAKTVTTNEVVNITFYSNIISDINADSIDANLVKTISLNLTAGITSLNYSGIFEQKNIIYLEKGHKLNLEYFINGKASQESLQNQVSVEIYKGDNLVEVSTATNVAIGENSNRFEILSLGELGQVALKLVSENGFELSEKTIEIYNFDENYENNLTLDLSSNNIKKVYDEANGNYLYYIGLTKNARNASIKVNNPNFTRVVNAEILSSDESKVLANLTSLEDLTFYLYASSKTDNPITITINIKLLNSNEFVNTANQFITHTLKLENLHTYNPIESIAKKQKQVEVVDGDSLDLDSLNKELNVLDVEKYLDIQKADNDISTLNVEYIMPSSLTQTTFDNAGNITRLGDYEFVENGLNPFKKIKFYAGKNQTFDASGKFTFSFTIRIEDIEGSGNYHLISLKVILKKHIAPTGIEVLNNNGYLYLTNNQGVGQIEARVYSETGNEVTNQSLCYEIKSGSSVDVDSSTGMVTVKAGGISEILIKANASKYADGGEYSVTKTIYVVVADGTENYPYIYNGNFDKDKYYTLNKDIELTESINVNVGGINGKFVYAKYTNLANKTAVYNMTYNGLDPIFGNSLASKLENLNIIINTKNVSISNNFGFVARENASTIKDINLIIPEIVLSISNDINVGLMFGENSGTIENCTVSGQAIVNGSSNFIFGSMVGLNSGEITSNYNFINKAQITNHASTLNILGDPSNATVGGIVGGIVGKNTANISNISAQALININAKIVGGIIGVNDSANKVHNVLFKGNICSNNSASLVGGIVGSSEKGTYELLITEFVNIAKTTFGANLKGNIVGGLIGQTNNSATISYSYVNSLVSFENYVDIEGDTVGGLVGTATTLTLTAVYSSVKLNEETKCGALVGNVETLEISDAYSFSAGANALANTTDTTTVTNTYSTNSSYVYNDYVYNEENSDGATNYTKLNYTSTVSNNNFKTGNWRYSTNLNNGLPYLVYTINGISYNLLTIVPNSISANFIAGNLIANSTNYYYGYDNNMVVINDNGENIRAIIYKADKLSYNIDDILNITTVPAGADKSNIKITSSNSSVIKVNDKVLTVVGTGNTTIKISYLQLQAVNVYISVVEKITELKGATDLTILKDHTKLYNINANGTGNNYGIYYSFNEDVEANILYNNFVIENQEVYANNDIHIFKGLSVTEYGTGVDQRNYVQTTIIPYYTVSFNGIEYKVFEYSLQKSVKFYVKKGATSIYSDARSLEVVDKSIVTFEVVTRSSDANEKLKIEDLSNNEFGTYFTVNDAEFGLNGVSISRDSSKSNAGENVYTITISANKGSIVNADIAFELKIYPETNQDLKVSVDVLLKSAKLISAELNHYSSSTYYYDDYNYIIQPQTLPNRNIVAGNLGVLNINLYPSYASLDKVEVVSSEVNNNKINFAQLAYKDDNLVAIQNAGNISNGIELYPDRSVLKTGTFSFDGNLYVSTLLPTNVTENTIFTITILCYFNNMSEVEEFKIDLIAKPLTSIVLSDSKGSGLYLAKGSELELDIKLINFDELDTLELSTDNFDITEHSNGDTTTYVNKRINSDNTKLILSTDILTPAGLEFTITPKFTQIVDGKEVTSCSNSITIKVVDFVVNSISVLDAQDGILNNNLGNTNSLKAVLNVTKCDGTGLDEDKKKLEFSIINDKIKYLEEIISKANNTFNIINQTGSGNEVYTNIVENGNYSNFIVTKNDDGYLELKGKVVSETNMLLKANISYENGLVQLNSNSNIEFRTPFVFKVKTYSSEDNPIPVKTYQEFLDMKEGEDYILLNNLDLPSDFTGINTNIASFDGNNKIINLNGFTIKDTTVTNLGLFNNISENTVIKNVTVNILPTIFYTNDSYFYGLNINAQSLTSLNFGVIAGTNAGVITNCKVVNNNMRTVNGQNQYKEVAININGNETIGLNVGGLVGQNTGFITNSKLGNRESSNTIKILANATIGGFVAINEGKIASSYASRISIINNAKTKMTGGFVAENGSNAQIITSYVEGYNKDQINNLEVDNSLQDGGISATNYVGGFVGTNDGTIKDSYSNLKITTNKRSAGFVYDNSNGYIETCFSASSNGTTNAQSFRFFAGNNEENIVLNNKGIKYSYYISENLDGDDDNEYSEPANGIDATSAKNADLFEGFVCDNSSSTVWVFDGDHLPTLNDANLKISSERVLLDEADSLNSQKYNYIYINNIYGNNNNPIIITTSEGLLNALTNQNNLYSYYFNGSIRKTNINYNHIQIVKDIDLSTIIDANNNKVNSSSEVQKLQDIIFAGNLNGNGMTISNITITAKNNITNYSSFGLLKQIGIELTYNAQGKIYNSYLDEDNCTIIKNINFDIANISATLTRSVGTLSGEVINSKLYNVNVSSQNHIIVAGSNMVGAVAGRISGNSYVKGVSSSLAVQATYDNQTNNYAYNTTQSKIIYRYAYDAIKDDLNNKVSFAGGLFGVVDIYETVLNNYAQQSDGKSYYINVSIVRSNTQSTENAHIQFVKTYGDIKVQGDVVGGLFGYVGTGSFVYDAQFVLENSNSQNLIADYSVGAIAGENSGYITYAKVEHEKEEQRRIDKNEATSSSDIFANTNNKALIVGGIVGILRNGVLTNSYSKANVHAPNSMYVGSSVGQFANSAIQYVYAVSNISAQNIEMQENSLITKNKGYAGFIGLVNSFNYSSNISNVVSIVTNESLPTEYNLSSVVGYNQVEDTTITGETGKDIDDISLTFGNALVDSSINYYPVYHYINKDSETFDSYGTNNKNWYVPTEYDEDTYPVLIYNKKAYSTSINSENDLFNMLDGGKYTLSSDIYLTKPWSPLNELNNIALSSDRRQGTQEEISNLGEYYKIYNLNINVESRNIANNIGFFSSIKRSIVENVTFVVGTNYNDPKDPEKVWIGTANGINIKNNNIQSSLSLGAVAGKAYSSTFTNVSVEFAKGIETNLQQVGGLVGYSDGCTFNGATIKGLEINKTCKDVTAHNNQYVGGLIGNVKNATIKENYNIAFKSISVTGTTNSGGNVVSEVYVGGFAGSLSLLSNNTAEDLNSVISGEAGIIIENAKTSCIGGFAGYLSSTIVLKGIKLSDIDINFKNNTPPEGELAANIGGLIGKAKIKDLNYISINSDCSIDIEITNEKGDNVLNAGGLIGFAENCSGEVSHISCFNPIDVQIKTNKDTNIGGIIGKNGASGKPSADGLNLEKVISGNNIIIKDPNGSSNNRIGGLVGYNYKETIKNSYYIGKIKLGLLDFNNVGAIVGCNVDNSGSANAGNSNVTNSYYIEDLAQVSTRKIDYGTPMSYADFISGLTTQPDTEDETITFIELLTDLVENQKLTIDNVEDDLSFTEGSVFKPFEVTESTTTFEESTTTFEENKYYVLKNNISLNNVVFKDADGIESNVFKANLIGNGKTITVSTTFADTISENALISSVVFKMSGNGTKIKGITYTDDVYSVIAKTNNGTIFNCVTIGDIYIKNINDNVAPIVTENIGYISNTISNNNILIGFIKSTENTVSSSIVAGFVATNSGTIYNSISSGNIEVFSKIIEGFDSKTADEKTTCKNNLYTSYNINSKNDFLQNNIAGFTLQNEEYIQNVVVATTLPEQADESTYNAAIVNSGNGKIKTYYVDYYAHGNYYYKEGDTGSLKDDIYKSTSDLISLLNSDPFYTDWSNSDIEVLYGYNYPQLSVYKTSDFIKEALNTTKTIDSATYYKANNFGVLNNIIKVTQETENSNILQVRTFTGVIKCKYKKEGEVQEKNHNLEEYTTKALTKSLTYDGNGFAINNLVVNENATDTEIYAGLFYTVEDGVEISISNLALTNVEISFTAQAKNIYVGGLVAKGNATTISGCYIDGKIETVQVTKTNPNGSVTTGSSFAENKNLYVGGFVGSMTSGAISNNVNNVDMLLHKFNVTDSSGKFYGYNANIGGIVGYTEGEITGNYTYNDITVSSVVSLNLGGIVGSTGTDAININNNLTLSKLAYSGAYIGYYASQGTDLIYNLNAIIGKKGSDTTEFSGNKYNKLVNFVNDVNIDDSDGTGVGALLEASQFHSNNDFMPKEEVTNNPSQMITPPKIEQLTASEGQELTFEDNTIYVVTTTIGMNLTLNSNNAGESLTNTTIIFTENVTTTISETIFNKLENCTISNLTIKTSGDLSGATLASSIENTKLYNITINDVYIKTEGQNISSGNGVISASGMLVNSATNGSLLSNITINKGRLEVNGGTDSRIGGVVGNLENSIVLSSTNDATITAYNLNTSVHVAGIVGYGHGGSSIFKCANNGLIYTKTQTAEHQYVSGIGNMSGQADFVSFCINNTKIKGVFNNAGGNDNHNYVSGVANSATVLYSINKGQVISISATKSLSASSGLSGGLKVYYSYNHGTISSTGYAYLITNGSANYTYNMGNGYTENSVSLHLACNGSNNYDMIESTQSQVDTIRSAFAELYDFRINQCDDETSGTGGNTTYDANLKKYIPYIRLLDPTNFALKTNDAGDTYLISTPFELWYWGSYVCGTNQDKNVNLTTDIDMTGMLYYNSGQTFNGTFDGQNHAIKNMVISNKGSEATSDNYYFGFIAKNSGTITNVYFEDCQLQQIKYISDSGDLGPFSGDKNYIGLVTGVNAGTITNVLVATTLDDVIMIDIDYQITTKSSVGHFYTGIIAGCNEKDIIECQVLSLKSDIIYQNILYDGRLFPSSELGSLVESFIPGGESEGLRSYTGGIVGYNAAEADNISKCVVVGAISANATNYNELNVVVATHTAACFQYIGFIAGSGTYSNCYAVRDTSLFSASVNNNAGSDQIGQYISINQGAITSDLVAALTPGMIMVVAKVLKNPKTAIKAIGTVIKNAGKAIVKLFTRKATTKLLGELTETAVKAGTKASMGPVGWVMLAVEAIGLGYTLIQAPNSFGVRYNEYNGYVDENNDSSVQSNFATVPWSKEETSPYLSIYTHNESGNDVILNKINEKLIRKSMPFLQSFLNMSKTSLNEPVANQNGKYYVNNANQFAWALTNGEDSTEVVLMDNIDMSKRVWDDDMPEIKSTINIDTNGFYINCGNNDIPDFDVYTNANYNVYGFEDTVSKNKYKVAYDNFNEAFKKSYEENQKGGQEDSYDNYDGYYPINHPDQLALISDALNSYSYSDGRKSHTGLNFSGKKFKLVADIDLSSYKWIDSIGIYNYDHTDQDEDPIEKYILKEAFDTEVEITTSQFFGAEIDGNGKTITLKENNPLFIITGGNAYIHDLNIVSKTTVNGTGFVTSLNLGKLDHINLKFDTTATNATVTFNTGEVDFIDPEYIYQTWSPDTTLDEDNTYVTKINGFNVSTENYVGMISGTNGGIIKNCKISNTENETITQFTVQINDNIVTTTKKYTINQKGGFLLKQDVTVEATLGLNDDGTVTSGPYCALTVTNNVGLIAGVNTGSISNINLEDVTLKVNSNKLYIDDSVINIENNTLAQKGDSNDKLIYSSITNVGLISAQNVHVSTNTPPNGESEHSINNITVVNCKIKTINNERTVSKMGIISAYSSISLKNIMAMNNTVCENSETQTDTSLVYLFSPEFYTYNSLTGKDKDGYTINEVKLTYFKPRIINTVSDSKLVMNRRVSQISKYTKQEGDNTTNCIAVRYIDLSTDKTGTLEFNTESGAVSINGMVIENGHIETDYEDVTLGDGVNEGIVDWPVSELTGKQLTFTRTINRTLIDASGVDITNQVADWGDDIANDNSFMRITKTYTDTETGVSPTTICKDMITNATIYVSTDVSTDVVFLQSLGLSVSCIANGTQAGDGSWIGNTGTALSGENYTATIGGKNFKVKTTVSANLSNSSGNYALTVTYESELIPIEVASGETYSSVFGTGFTVNESASLDTTFTTSEIYTLTYDGNSFDVQVNVTEPEPVEPEA